MAPTATKKTEPAKGAPTAVAEQEQAAPAPQQGLAQTGPNQMQGPTPSRVPVQMGIAPKTLEEGWRLATMLAKSELVPKNFRNKPEDILVAIQMGMELGLPPLQSLASIAVINGRASIWGDGFIALIMSSPLYEDHDEYYEVEGKRADGLTVADLAKDSTTAICTFHRRGKSTPVTRRFSIGQAKKAGLIGKEGPWSTYPDRMLAMRARGFAGRDAFPDLLRGITTAEEAHDLPPAGEVIEPPREVRRLSETKATEPVATSAPNPAPTPAADTIAVGPIGVKAVQQFMGAGYVLITDAGEQIEIGSDADALELDKFVATNHKVRLVCERQGAGLKLQSFAIAD